MESEKQAYILSLKQICPALTGDELSLFASKLSYHNLQKKEFFIEAGTVQKAIGFITAGLVRSFYVDPTGDEITVGFYQAGDYATHYHSFLTRQPSNYTIQCLEPTTLACLSYEDLQWVY